MTTETLARREARASLPSPRGKALIKERANFTELRALIRKAMAPQGDEEKPLSAQRFLEIADPKQHFLWSSTTFHGILDGSTLPDGGRRDHIPDQLTFFVLAVGINRRLGTYYSGEDLWRMLIGPLVDYPIDADPDRGLEPKRKKQKGRGKKKPLREPEPEPEAYLWTAALNDSLEDAEEHEGKSALLFICSEAELSLQRLNALRGGEHPTEAEAKRIAKTLAFFECDREGRYIRVYDELEVIAMARPYSR